MAYGNDVKPGYRTTEFWVTLATMGLGVLVAIGMLAPEEAEALKSQVQVIGELIVKIAAAAMPIVYIIARARLKANSARLKANS